MCVILGGVISKHYASQLILMYFIFLLLYPTLSFQRRLTQKYSIAVGVPTLIIRGRPVRDALLADPGAQRFPWPAPPLKEVLRGVPLQGRAGLKSFDELPDGVRVFYFGAHWVR